MSRAARPSTRRNSDAIHGAEKGGNRLLTRAAPNAAAVLTEPRPLGSGARESFLNTLLKAR